MLIYLVFFVGLAVGIALTLWHESLHQLKDNEYVIIRKFEYYSSRLMAYNSVREAFEQHANKFKLITLKYTGSVLFDNCGIMLKYMSLHGHTLKFNYDMSRFEVIDPPKAN